MKSFNTLFVLLAFTFASNAQIIPNGDLESWIPSPGAWSEVPEGWSHQNWQLMQSAYKEEDACEGDFALKLTPMAGIESIMGAASLEFPISAIPAELNFCVKTNIESDDFFTDTCRVIISFWNGDNQFYSEEWLNTESISEWTQVSIPLQQIEPVMDACLIEVQSSYPGIGLGSGSTLTWISVDDFRFENTNSVLNHEEAIISIYPNPSKSGAFILQSDEILKEFIIIDLLGNVVLSQASVNEKITTIKTDLPTGMYFLKWNGQTKKIIIEH